MDKDPPPAFGTALQQQFLREALRWGAFAAVEATRRNLLGVYFGSSQASLAALRPLAGGTSTEHVRQLILAALTTAWHQLPPAVQAQYPLAAIRKGKPASPRTPAVRAQLRARLRAQWQDPTFRTRVAAAAWHPDKRAKASAAQRRRWQDPGYRHHFHQQASATQRQYWQDPDRRRRLSERIKAKWQDPVFRDKWYAARYPHRPESP